MVGIILFLICEFLRLDNEFILLKGIDELLKIICNKYFLFKIICNEFLFLWRCIWKLLIIIKLFYIYNYINLGKLNIDV